MAEIMEVKLPETSEDITESLIVFWHKAEGDWVEQGEVLLEVQTEKAVFEVEAPASGKLSKILAKRGEVAAVGDVLAFIELTAAADTIETPPEADRSNEMKSLPQASPRLRKLAKELGVDLRAVVGSGPGGRVTEEDVRNAAYHNPSSDQTVELTPIRRTIAKRMMQSLQQTAQLTLTSWADVTLLAEIRKQLAPDVSWNSWILRAIVLALQEHPDLNGVLEENQIRQFSHVHLGVAADTDDGLLVPTIKHAERFNLFDLHSTVNQAVEKAREGKLTTAELSGSTFTVTNLGSYGIQFFTPILNPPEVAILGIGQIEPHVMFQDRNLIQQERLPLSLTFDHRAIDGAPAARFLQTVIELLGEPERLL